MKLWQRAQLVGDQGDCGGSDSEHQIDEVTSASYSASSNFFSDSDQECEDFYLLIRREENPHFDIYKSKEVQALIRSAPWNLRNWLRLLVYTRKPPSHPCATQLAVENQDAAPSQPSAHSNTTTTIAPRIFLGRDRGILTLWASGSVINWAARRDGWSSVTNAIAVVRACAWATQRWNRACAGRVIFRYVDRCDKCAFLLEPAYDEGDVLAESFAPNAVSNTINSLRVYDAAFRPENINYLRGTLLHEVGHIVGLRHEHAQDTEDSRNGPESISFGNRNSKSVMAYYRGQRIRFTDVMAVRLAYDTLEDGMVVRGNGKFGIVEKTVRRVHPSN